MLDNISVWVYTLSMEHTEGICQACRPKYLIFRDIEKGITAETIENLFKDFYDGDWFADSGDWVKLDRLATELKQKIYELSK